MSFLSKFSLPVLLVLAITAKLWLAWGSEIADAIDDPHEYVLQVLFPSRGGLTYPPGTGIAGRFFYDLHIPYRLGLEISFLIASALVIRALLAWPWKSTLALILFVLVIFDPAPAELFSHFYSDQVWLIETVLGLSLFVLAFRHTEKLQWSLILFSLLCFGLSIVTRSVTIPLLAASNLFALLALGLVVVKFHSYNLRPNLNLLALSLPTLILGICLIYGSVCRYNLVHHGYTGLCCIDSKEYKDFYLCLQSVGDPDGVKYFPIDENRRRFIAQAGPTSKWFIQQLDENAFYKQAGLKYYGKYDIASGWFHWASFTATMHDGDYMSAFAIFHTIEDEIASANQLGQIRVRHVISLPDCRLAIVATAIPDGFRNTFAQIISEPNPDSFAWKNGAYVDPQFTQALTRHAVSPSPLRENIWAFLINLYAWIYTYATLALLALSLLLFLAALLWRWNRIEEFPLSFVARQFFAVLFAVLIFWYVLFDASGMPVVSRYMIFNHLLLLPLIGYYLSVAARLFRSACVEAPEEAY